MPNVTSNPSDVPEGRMNRGPSSLYLQHPQSARLDEVVLIPGSSLGPVTVSKAVAFVYELLWTPRTKQGLVCVLTERMEEVGLANSEVTVEVESILQALIGEALAIEIAPGVPVPADPHAPAKRLLWEAQQRLSAGDWSAAVALCGEAGKDAAFAAVAELNALIARYQEGSFDGMVEQACMLSPRLTSEGGRACCDALALLVAHRTGDLATAKLVAVYLARRYSSPWDLPTVPECAVQARGGQIIVRESSAVEPMLAVIEGLLAARVCRPDESALLVALAQRYRERQAKSG